MPYILSERTIRTVSKYSMQFADYWFNKYVKAYVAAEICEQTNCLADFKLKMMQAISTGLKAIETKQINKIDYAKLGRIQQLYGISIQDTLVLGELFIEAMANFLMERKADGELELNEHEIDHYLVELHALNEIVIPCIVAGYEAEVDI